MRKNEPAERTVRDIRRKTRKQYTAEEAPDIAVIHVPVLRLDHRLDRQRLLETVERTRFSPRHKRASVVSQDVV